MRNIHYILLTISLLCIPHLFLKSSFSFHRYSQFCESGVGAGVIRGGV